jgi:hypothetical protein
VANSYSLNVSVLLNNGDGTFQQAVNYGAGGGPRSVFAADLDGDGDNDLAMANYDGISILINLSDIPVGCDYVPGDCDHNGIPLEQGDAIAMIGMYRGSVVPPYECSCPPHGDNFTPTADPNGNCVALELGDVVTEIAAYRGSGTASGCEDCPGSLRLLPAAKIIRR